MAPYDPFVDPGEKATQDLSEKLRFITNLSPISSWIVTINNIVDSKTEKHFEDRYGEERD